MKPQKSRDVKKLMTAQGWRFLRQGRGSHEVWTSADESQKVTVPFGHTEISAGVLTQLQKAGLTVPDKWS